MKSLIRSYCKNCTLEIFTLLGREMLWSTSMILTPSSNLNRFFFNKLSILFLLSNKEKNRYFHWIFQMKPDSITNLYTGRSLAVLY